MSKAQNITGLRPEQKLKLIKQMALISILIGGGTGVAALLSIGVPNLSNRYSLLAGGIFQITFFLLAGTAMLRSIDLIKAQKLLLVFTLGVATDAILQIALQGMQHMTLILISHTLLALFATSLRSLLRR